MKKAVILYKTHKQKDLYAKFRKEHPNLKPHVLEWFPGGDSIILHIDDGRLISYDGVKFKQEGVWGSPNW